MIPLWWDNITVAVIYYEVLTYRSYVPGNTATVIGNLILKTSCTEGLV